MEDPQALAGLLKGDESDDDFHYEEVEVMSEDEDDGASEDLDAALRSLKAFTSKDEPPAARPAQEVPPGQVTRKPEVMDDFLRNFFVKMGLSRTCETFEAEWYELKATGKLEGSQLVPDIYQRNSELEEEVTALRRELNDAKHIASKASATWDKFRKERDFHRMHHKRVSQEKNKLVSDIKRLKEHYAKYEPTILELKRKYEVAMKEKMLISLNRDKVSAKMEALETRTISSPQPKTAESPLKASNTASQATANAFPASKLTSQHTATTAKRSGWVTVMGPQKKNPYEDLEFEAVNIKGFSLQKTFKGHLMSVANLAIHPTKPILVTVSDDKTWKMWHMPAGDLIMCGEGHKDWVAGVDFHPAGTALATGSGDNTVKIWDFEKQRCTVTFTDHKQAVWGVKYHYAGDVLASCSLDHTVRLWDIPAAKCRIALRGHVDSVNDVAWQPFTPNLATASSDKTVSIWDARSGLCSQTFYGHQNSCNAVAFNLMGTVLASTDADGMVKLWDTRMVAEILTIEASKQPANKCALDRSGEILAVASDDGKVRGFRTTGGELVGELSAHDDAAQAVAFDPAGEYLISCGSDKTFRLWS
jgi:WD40 repeat protein